MKKILVLSDSHGNITNMIHAVRKEQPDLILHLGDCMSDFERLRELFCDIEADNVPGNCDASLLPATKMLSIENKRIMMTHGHNYQVKSSYLNIELAGKEREADLVLFGHTHRVYYDYHNGIRLFNPGSIGRAPADIPCSYGVLLVDADRNELKMQVEYLENI